MTGDAFQHVRSGQRYQPNATALNAMIDVAKAHSQGKLSSTNTALQYGSDYDILIYNGLGDNLPRFSVVCIGEPLTLPADNFATFAAGGAFTALLPSNAKRYKFAVLQEPIRDGGIGRALTCGYTPVLLELLPPEDTDDDWADILPDTVTCLQGAAHGNAKVLCITPYEDRGEDPQRAWAVVCLGAGGPGEEFAVRVSIDSGSAGSGSTNCSWTYEVSSLRGKVVATGQTPALLREPLLEYVETPDNSEGTAFYDEDGNFVLFNANELPAIHTCDDGGGGETIDGGDSDFVE